MELIITIPEKSLPLIDAVRTTETGDRGELEDWIRAQVEALLMDMIGRQKQRQAASEFVVAAKAEAFVEVKRKEVKAEEPKVLEGGLENG